MASQDAAAEAAAAEARYQSWVERIKRIEDETTDLFWDRHVYRAVRKMFVTNPELRKDGSAIFRWIATLYGRNALMAVRRELDGQAGVINLHHLLHEMEDHAQLLTRSRYRRFFQSWFPTTLIDEEFEGMGGPPGPGSDNDHVSAESIRASREELERAARPALEYAQRMVAHRTAVNEFPLTWGEIDQAIRAIFKCLRRYHVLLTGASLASATPFPQFDWLRPFRYAWADQNLKPPPIDEDAVEDEATS